MSSLRDVPPVVTMQCSSGIMCFPISFTMADVWRASSRVGMRMSTVMCNGGREDRIEKKYTHVALVRFTHS